MDLTVHSEDTVSGTLVYAVDRDYLQADGEGRHVVREAFAAGPMGRAISGRTRTMTEPPTRKTLAFTHRKDRYIVRGDLDMAFGLVGVVAVVLRRRQPRSGLEQELLDQPFSRRSGLAC